MKDYTLLTNIADTISDFSQKMGYIKITHLKIDLHKDTSISEQLLTDHLHHDLANLLCDQFNIQVFYDNLVKDTATIKEIIGTKG